MPAPTRYFEAYGAAFAFCCDEAGLREEIEAVLPPGARPAGAVTADVEYGLRRQGSRLVLARDGEDLYDSEDLDYLLNLLRSDLDVQVAQHARPWLFIHAGVVAWRSRAIVVPGRSMSGKSTLVAALAGAGAEYLSDEYAVLDEEGLVHPYPRPVSLRGEGPLPRIFSATELGWRTASGPLPLGLVVSARFVAGSSWQPRVLSAGQAALALVDNTVMARARSADMLRRLARALESAVALEGTRGEADEVVADLLRRLGGPEENLR